MLDFFRRFILPRKGKYRYYLVCHTRKGRLRPGCSMKYHPNVYVLLKTSSHTQNRVHSQFSGDILTLYDGYSIFEYPCLEQVYNRFNPIRKHRIPIEEPYANSITARIPRYSKDKEWTHASPLYSNRIGGGG
ncbi:hypothetical protein GHT06_020325 [Daphnia sinensis]|uniref:Uncharacterized protein n=1 Tax=Daphnia sinensis TaxID=1820382 RepID=A0AAD5PRH6_9CRUS|nr:hypothetical protein GHT06_020325 [Daphnia sinensis]